MIPKADILFYLDGILAQLAISKQLYEARKIDTSPITSGFASVMSLRNLIDASEPEVEVDPDGPCPHPENAQKKTELGGDNWFITCHACNEIIKQSSD